MNLSNSTQFSRGIKYLFLIAVFINRRRCYPNIHSFKHPFHIRIMPYVLVSREMCFSLQEVR